LKEKTMNATKYSLEEQIISQIARCYKSDDALAVNATTMCGLTGIALAQRLYAPGILIQREANGQMAHLTNFHLPYEPGNVPQDSLEVYLENERIWELVFGAKWNIIMQPVQIDQFGNVNLSVVGNKIGPDRVFVGSRGFPDNTVYCERVYYFIPEHTKRVFVNQVDFISGVGHGPIRKDIKIKNGAPHLVFSNLGVFDFDESTGRMRVKSIHSGLDLQDVIQNTGFELLTSGTVQESDSPSEEELRLIRDEIDPLGMRRLDFLKGEDYSKLADQIRQERERGSKK